MATKKQHDLIIPKKIRPWPANFNNDLSNRTGHEVYRDEYSLVSEDYAGCSDITVVHIFVTSENEYWVHANCNNLGYCQAKLLGTPNVDTYLDDDDPLNVNNVELVDKFCQDHFGVGIDKTTFIDS